MHATLDRDTLHLYMDTLKPTNAVMRTLFFLMFALLVLMTCTLFLLTYFAARGYQFPGLLFFVPVFIVFIQIFPHIVILSHFRDSVVSLATLTIPSLVLTIALFVIGPLYHEHMIAIFSIFSILITVLSTVTFIRFRTLLRRIKSLVALELTAQPLAASPKSIHKYDIYSIIRKVVLCLFIILFVIPVAFGLVIAITRSVQ